MAAARRRVVIEPEVQQPLDETMFIDQQGIAGDFGDVLDALSGFDAGAIKGFLYKRPSNGVGKYEIIEEAAPPFDMSAIVTDLKERFGGGDFQLRLMAGGRVRKNIDFSIVKERAPIVAAKTDNGDMATMFMGMMQMQSAAADRQMSMMMQMGQQQTAMLTAILPAMMGGKDKTSEVMAAMAPYLTKNDNGMKEALETLTLAKGLFKEDPEKGAGFDADDLVGSALKLGGPIVGAIGKAFGNRREAAENPTQHYEPPPQNLMLPSGPAGEAARAGPSRFPIIDLIREDVLFTFRRNHDPEKAAELVYDVIEAAGVDDGALNDLVAAFTVSPDWLGELAAEGIDLRANPQWAEHFIQALVAIHTDAVGNDEHSGGNEGRETDPSGHGPAGAAGLDANGSPKSGG